MSNEIVFRLFTVLLLTAALSMSASFRHRAEKQGGQMTSAEGQGLVVVLRLLGLVVMLPLLGYLANPQWVAWARLPLPTWARWLAAGVGLALLPVFYWILSTIGTNISPTQATRQDHQLITHGPYRCVRHPLYTAGILFVVALAVLTALWWVGVAFALPLVILVFRTRREEALLIEHFGDAYRAYMKRTGRFLPRLRPAR
ncbi:MAG: isoprenylcysteine carboxylmethyltransferase family protein [Chloroflexota bacterium]